jgi:acetyl esterase
VEAGFPRDKRGTRLRADHAQNKGISSSFRDGRKDQIRIDESEFDLQPQTTGSFIMPVILDPDAAFVFKAFQEAGRPAYETISPTEARKLYLNARVVTNPEPPELKSVQPLAIPSPHGSVPARLYTPKTLRQTNGLAPCLVFFHGGGWVIGDLDSHDVACRKLADEGQLLVVSVDYRLAPEHKFPAAVDDAVAATRWIAENAKQLGVDAARLVVGGDSAGGNLAAVVAISARDDNGPPIAGQVLIYPATDFSMTHSSHREPETSILLTHAAIRWFSDHYLNGPADAHDWRASPARAKKLAGLPPAYVLTAGADPLRDEGDEYARLLKEAGVPVTYRHFPGQFHGFFTMGKLLQQANVAASEIGAWLKALS